MGKRGVSIRMSWVLLVFVSQLALTQSPVQVVEILVRNAQTEAPLQYANVLLVHSSDTLGAYTDERGIARFERVKTGYYQAVVRYIGFETHVQGDLLVQASRPSKLEVALQIQNLPDICVVGEPIVSILNPISTIQLTVEQALRFPATFQDPARLAATYPGVVVQNDQGNNLIVRGNSPLFNHWRLEGMEITNPNHTANAGTLSDRITQAGGGVNMLSAQVLANSRLLKGAYPAFYDNALGGILDMYFRPGLTDQPHFTLQAGLIGVEAAAEGPFKRSGEASYLVNYRYSTIGLLNLLGLELGDEAIQFQDLSFHVKVPLAPQTDLRLFGVGGQSSNLFEPSLDSTLWEEQRDQTEVLFLSRQTTAGFVLTQDLGTMVEGTLRGMISDWQSERTSEILDSTLMYQPFSEDAFRQTQASLNTHWEIRWGPTRQLNAGITGTWRNFAQTGFLAPNNERQPYAGKISILEGQAYAQGQWAWGRRWGLDLGVSYLWQNAIAGGTWQPTGTIYWKFKPGQQIQMNYRGQAQSPPLSLLAEEDQTGALISPDLDWMRGRILSLGYQQRLGKRFVLEAELYQQWLRQIPVEGTESPFSAINLVQVFRYERSPLNSNGGGMNRGVEVNVRTFSFDTWYINLSSTLYQSQYQGSDQVWRSTAFDGRYLFYATGGRSFSFSKHPNRTLELHGSGVVRGGLRYQPIDVFVSKAAGYTVFQEKGFTEQLSPYFRMDVRLTYRWEKPRRTNHIYLDLQNASNQQNTAFFYYDPRQETVLEKRQLGLIPILSYRLSW